MPNKEGWLETFVFRFSEYVHKEDIPEKFPAGDMRNVRRIAAIYGICAKVIEEIEEEEMNPPTTP